MKNIKLLLAAALFTGAASLALAGPGPDHWARLNKAEKDHAEAKAQAAAQAKAEAAPQVACTSCSCCAGIKKS